MMEVVSSRRPNRLHEATLAVSKPERVERKSWDPTATSAPLPEPSRLRREDSATVGDYSFMPTCGGAGSGVFSNVFISWITRYASTSAFSFSTSCPPTTRAISARDSSFSGQTRSTIVSVLILVHRKVGLRQRPGFRLSGAKRRSLSVSHVLCQRGALSFAEN